MAKIYITGDKHREYDNIVYFCDRFMTTKRDVMIVLGDNGINFLSKKKDDEVKNLLQGLPITFILIRGNHDRRPSDVKSYKKKLVVRENFSGEFFVEDEYPDLLFTTEGYYSFKVGEESKTAYIINGAYSVDKWHRLQSGRTWFNNEQLSKEEMDAVDKELIGHKVSYIMSHTCPQKYEPVEMFMPFVDQSTVDKTMEKWLDKIEDGVEYDKWFCGHWHVSKSIDKMRFMYHDIVILE